MNLGELLAVDHLWTGFGFVEFENAKVRAVHLHLPVLSLFFSLLGCRRRCAQFQRKTVHGGQVRTHLMEAKID